ncbi:MAG: GNAT family N-acetyltransferase [Chloroflexi bacterium]|nr:GNAT family N-acetyltransferase [Chloroflexota bacterium]
MTPKSSLNERGRPSRDGVGAARNASLPAGGALPIQRLDARQAEAAAATLSDAFFDDPLLQIIAPDEARRRRWGPWFMSLIVQYGLRRGEVSCIDGTSAVAVWVPPGSGEMSFGRMLRVGFAWMPFRLGVANTSRFLRAMSATESFHKTVDGPHWYLAAVGARPELQGRGMGSSLVEVGTSQADEAGMPCYLETGTQSNIDFYAKRGFEIVGQAQLFGHTLTGMVRPPRGTSAR